jgi:syntaxin 5
LAKSSIKSFLKQQEKLQIAFPMITRRRRTRSGNKEDTPTNFESGYGYPISNGDTFADDSNSHLFDSFEMTCRDRTGEFVSAFKSLQSRQSNGYSPNHRYGQDDRLIKPASQFTLLSRRIGKDISNTFNKLEKLAILAKRKSLFDDKPIEIQELTYIIKQDITSLNKQISQLQQFVGQGDSQKSKNVQTHSHTVVISLQSKLAYMSKDFKNVLEVRTENMKQQKSRREQFSQGSVAESLPAAAMNSNSLLNKDSNFAPHVQHSDSIALDMTAFQGNQAQSMIEEKDEYIKSRATAMESIEQTIVELGGIFQQLAHLVSEQEEQIKRIDMNVEDTEMNVEAAHSELLKYFQSISSNRWLIINIFFVLIVFFIAFVVFMV